MGTNGYKSPAPALDLALDRQSPLPIYAQISDQIRRQIQIGRLAVGAPLPSSGQIQKQYNVNYKTVHQAMGLLARQGYLIRQPRKGTFVRGIPRTGMVGVFCTLEQFRVDQAPGVSLMIQHLVKQMQETNASYRLYLGAGDASSNNAALEDFRQDIEAGRLIGAILLSYRPWLDPVLNAAERLRVPVVGITFAFANRLRVWIDESAFFRLVGQRLRSLGRSRTGVIYNNYQSQISSTEQLMALLTTSGISSKPAWIAGARAGIEGGLAAARALPLDALDSLVIADDLMAIGVDRHLQTVNAKVPDDLAVLTWWNAGSSLFTTLPFVRVEVDIEGITRRALGLLWEAIRGRRIQQPCILIPPRIVQNTPARPASPAVAVG